MRPYKDKDTLEQDYDRLGSQTAVAKAHKVTQSTISVWLRKHGIQPKPRGGDNNPHGLGGRGGKTIHDISRRSRKSRKARLSQEAHSVRN